MQSPPTTTTDCCELQLHADVMHLRLVGALAAGSARGADQRSFEELADVRFRVKGALRDGRRQRGIRSSGNPISSSAMNLTPRRTQ